MIPIMFDSFISTIVSHATACKGLEKGACLFRQGDPVRSVFVVASGTIELTRFNEGGTTLILQRAEKMAFLAEASVYSEYYHCDAIAAENSAVHELRLSAFTKLLADDKAFFHAWAAHLAREVQSTRYRCEILSRKTVSDRLDGWLLWKEGKLPPKGQWKSIALQIGVSPESFYRELAKRRNE